MTIQDLPLINACLNGLSAVLLLAGFICICIRRVRRVRAHQVFMVSAFISSTIFLGCYLTYHFFHVATKFSHPGWIKYAYYAMLASHVILAMICLPLVFMTLIPAIQKRFDRHRKIARWTFPIWMYVSITGVLVYMMLYRWFPS